MLKFPPGDRHFRHTPSLKPGADSLNIREISQGYALLPHAVWSCPGKTVLMICLFHRHFQHTPPMPPGPSRSGFAASCLGAVLLGLGGWTQPSGAEIVDLRVASIEPAAKTAQPGEWIEYNVRIENQSAELPALGTLAAVRPEKSFSHVVWECRLDPPVGSLRLSRSADGQKISYPAVPAPSHLSRSPSESFLYVSSSKSNALYVLVRSLDDPGRYEILQTIGQDSLLNAPLRGVSRTWVSPDARFVYAAASIDNALTVFQVDARSGRLNPVQTITNKPRKIRRAQGIDEKEDGLAQPAQEAPEIEIEEEERDGSRDAVRSEEDASFDLGNAQEDLPPLPLAGVEDLAGTADGAYLYAAAAVDHAIVGFQRDPEKGTLTPAQALQPEDISRIDLHGARALEMGPEGNELYAAAFRDDALMVLRRDTGTGELSLLQAVKRGDGGLLTNLREPYDLALSPDGRYLYVCAFASDALLVFERESFGKIRPIQAFLGEELAADPDFSGLFDGPTSLVVSGDGTRVVVACRYSNSVVEFERRLDGRLSFLGARRHGQAGLGAFQSPSAVILGEDGESFIAVAEDSSAMARFSPASDMPAPAGAGEAEQIVDLPPGTALHYRLQGRVEPPIKTEGVRMNAAVLPGPTVKDPVPDDNRLVHELSMHTDSPVPKFSLTLDRSHYEPGDPFAIELRISNPHPRPVNRSLLELNWPESFSSTVQWESLSVPATGSFAERRRDSVYDVTGGEIGDVLAMAGSADGRHYYILSDDPARIYRAAERLTEAGRELEWQRCALSPDHTESNDALSGAVQLMVSPDGLSAFAVNGRQNLLAELSRNPYSGELRLEKSYQAVDLGLRSGQRLGQVVCSPEGKHLYALVEGEPELMILGRTISQQRGESHGLTYLSQASFGDAGALSEFTFFDRGRRALAISDPGGSVLLFDRNVRSGGIQLTGRFNKVASPRSLVLSPEERHLYLYSAADQSIHCLQLDLGESLLSPRSHLPLNGVTGDLEGLDVKLAMGQDPTTLLAIINDGARLLLCARDPATGRLRVQNEQSLGNTSPSGVSERFKGLIHDPGLFRGLALTSNNATLHWLRRSANVHAQTGTGQLRDRISLEPGSEIVYTGRGIIPSLAREERLRLHASLTLSAKGPDGRPVDKLEAVARAEIKASPVLHATMDVVGDSVVPGGRTILRYRLKNESHALLEGVKVRAELPEFLNGVTWSGSSPNGATRRWETIWKGFPAKDNPDLIHPPITDGEGSPLKVLDATFAMDGRFTYLIPHGQKGCWVIRTDQASGLPAEIERLWPEADFERQKLDYAFSSLTVIPGERLLAMTYVDGAERRLSLFRIDPQSGALSFADSVSLSIPLARVTPPRLRLAESGQDEVAFLLASAHEPSPRPGNARVHQRWFSVDLADGALAAMPEPAAQEVSAAAAAALVAKSRLDSALDKTLRVEDKESTTGSGFNLSMPGRALRYSFDPAVDGFRVERLGVATFGKAGEGPLEDTISLSPGRSVEYLIRGEISSTQKGNFRARGIASWEERGDSGTDNAVVSEAMLEKELSPRADLELNLSNEQAVRVGTPFTVQTTLINHGPSDAYGIYILQRPATGLMFLNNRFSEATGQLGKPGAFPVTLEKLSAGERVEIQSQFTTAAGIDFRPSTEVELVAYSQTPELKPRNNLTSIQRPVLLPLACGFAGGRKLFPEGKIARFHVVISVLQERYKGLILNLELPEGVTYRGHRIITNPEESGGVLQNRFQGKLPQDLKKQKVRVRSGQIELKLGDVLAGETGMGDAGHRFLIDFDLAFGSAPGEVTLGASVDWENREEKDWSAARHLTQSVTVTVQQPELLVTKRLIQPAQDAGDEVTYELELKAADSIENCDAYEIILREELDENFELIGADCETLPLQEIRQHGERAVRIKKIEAGSLHTVELHGRIRDDAPSGSTVSNKTLLEYSSMPLADSGDRKRYQQEIPSPAFTLRRPRFDFQLNQREVVERGREVVYDAIVSLPEGRTDEVEILAELPPYFQLVSARVNRGSPLLDSAFQGNVTEKVKITKDPEKKSHSQMDLYALKLGEVLVAADNDPSNNSFAVEMRVRPVFPASRGETGGAMNGRERVPARAVLSFLDGTEGISLAPSSESEVSFEVDDPSLMFSSAVVASSRDTGIFQYKLVVRNPDDYDLPSATNVKIRTVIPDGLELSSIRSGFDGIEAKAEDSVVEILLRRLRPGEEAIISVEAIQRPEPADSMEVIPGPTLDGEDETVLPARRSVSLPEPAVFATPGDIE